VQLGRGGEELAEVVVLRHHRVRQRQRCDHVEERRSHLIARGGVVRPIVGDAHGLRPYRNGRPRTGTGRAHARTHARTSYPLSTVGKRTAMHRALS
jgi:hypothetical protein